MGGRMRQSRGFTLAEVLVATTLLSIVMASVYTLFGSTLRTWRSAEDKFDNYQNARLAMGIMRRELDNVAPQAGYLMNGNRREIEFICVAEPFDVEGNQGRHMMRVRYRFNRTGGTVVREEALVEVALPNPTYGEEVEPATARVRVRNRQTFVIAENVRDFQIRYIWIPAKPNRDLKKPPEREPPILATRHEENWGLPRGIQITMTLVDPDNRRDQQTFVMRRFLSNPGYGHVRDKLMEMLGGDIAP